jgi:hypothetical protein
MGRTGEPCSSQISPNRSQVGIKLADITKLTKAKSIIKSAGACESCPKSNGNLMKKESIQSPAAVGAY